MFAVKRRPGIPPGKSVEFHLDEERKRILLIPRTKDNPAIAGLVLPNPLIDPYTAAGYIAKGYTLYRFAREAGTYVWRSVRREVIISRFRRGQRPHVIRIRARK